MVSDEQHTTFSRCHVNSGLDNCFFVEQFMKIVGMSSKRITRRISRAT